MRVLDSKKRFGIAAGLLASAIWGGMYVVSKVVLEVIPPFLLLSLRLLLGAAALGLGLAWAGHRLNLTRRQWALSLAVGALGHGISLGLQFAGTRLSTAANGAVVTAATPAFVFLFAWGLLRERMHGRGLLALLLSTVGVLAVINPAQSGLETDLGLGNLFLLGAALTWALYSVLVRRATREVGALPFTFVALLGGLPAALPLGASEWLAGGVGRVDGDILAGVLYLGLISTALAAWLWNTAFERLEAGTASLTFFAQPLVGAVLAAWLLGEPLTAQFLLGGILVLMGIYMAAGASARMGAGI